MTKGRLRRHGSGGKNLNQKAKKNAQPKRIWQRIV
jgi:hypothetical protein